MTTTAEQSEPADEAAATRARLRAYLRTRLTRDLPAQVRANPEDTTTQRRWQLGRTLLQTAAAEHAETELLAGHALLDADTEARVIEDVLQGTFGLGGFQPLLADPQVETITVNRFDRVFVHTSDGRRTRVAPVADSNDALTALIRTLAARASSEERRFDRGAPALNLQLPDGERLFAVLGVTGGGVTACTIRRHGYRTASLAQLRRAGTLDAGLERFLRAMVRARKNVLITGGTGAGKTTLLRALAAEMDPAERLITVEDAFELGLDLDPDLHADVTSLQAREPNIEGHGVIDQSDLVRWALRMSPDRVIVGEIRGPEVIPMCNAMSQGNDGSMATLHASSSNIAFTRLASYAAQAAERLPLEATALLVASAVHFVVHLDRATDHTTRVISSIREVTGAEAATVISNEIHRPGPDRRALPVPGALRTHTLDDLVAAGFDPGLLDPQGWWSP